MSDADVLADASLSEAVVQGANLRDESGRLDMGTPHRLSETSGSVLDVDAKFTTMGKIKDPMRANTLDLMQATKAKYEPVLYMPASGGVKAAEFMPAIVAHDEETPTSIINNHVALPDIGLNTILEEAVRDPQKPDKIIDVRYWIKSTKKEAVDKAKQVRWGADRDTNNLLSEPIVLEQISEETAAQIMEKNKDKLLVRYDDLAEPSRGYAMMNSVTEEKKQLRPLAEQAAPAQVKVEVVSASPVAEDQKVVEREVEKPAVDQLKPKADLVVELPRTNAELKLKVGDVEYTSISKPKGKFNEVVYKDGTGNELNQDQMIDSLRNHRIGQVSREKDELYWEVPQDHIQPLTGEAFTNKAGLPVIYSGEATPSAEALALIDVEGQVLANTEQLARENAYTVKIVRGDELQYEGTPEEQVTNKALDNVALLVSARSSNANIIIQGEGGVKYEVHLTQYLSSDGKRVVMTEEDNESQKTVVRRVRLVDNDTAKSWATSADIQSNSGLLQAVLSEVTKDSTEKSPHQVLDGIDRVIGIQQN